MGPSSGPVQDQGGNPKAVILHQSRLSRGDYLALRTGRPTMTDGQCPHILSRPRPRLEVSAGTSILSKENRSPKGRSFSRKNPLCWMPAMSRSAHHGRRSVTTPRHYNGHPEIRRLQQRARISRGVCRSRVRTPREQSGRRFGLRRKLFFVSGLRGGRRAGLCHRAPRPCRDDSAPEKTGDGRLCMPRGRRMSGAARHAPGGDDLVVERPQEYTKAAKSVQSKSSPKGKLMKAKITLSLVAVALLFVASTPALAADTVLRVVVVQTDDVAGYVEQLV